MPLYTVERPEEDAPRVILAKDKQRLAIARIEDIKPARNLTDYLLWNPLSVCAKRARRPRVPPFFAAAANLPAGIL